MNLDKMEIEMQKRKIILQTFQDGLTPLHAQEAIEEKFGDCLRYGIRTCERWFTKFRKGSFDLDEKPRDKPKKDDYCKRRRPNKKADKNKNAKAKDKEPIQVKQVTFKQGEIPKPSASKEPEKHSDMALQKLIQKKRDLTISKVPKGKTAKQRTVEPNLITISPSKAVRMSSPTPTPSKIVHLKRQGTATTLPTVAAKKSLVTPAQSHSQPSTSTTERTTTRKVPTKKNIPTTKPAPKRVNHTATTTKKLPLAVPTSGDGPMRQMPKLRPRTAHPQRIDIDIQLSESTAKRMSQETSKESPLTQDANKVILEPKSSKDHPHKNSGPVTVQFQDITPQVARNTVRKRTNITDGRKDGSILKPHNPTSNNNTKQHNLTNNNMKPHNPTKSNSIASDNPTNASNKKHHNLTQNNMRLHNLTNNSISKPCVPTSINSIRPNNPTNMVYTKPHLPTKNTLLMNPHNPAIKNNISAAHKEPSSGVGMMKIANVVNVQSLSSDISKGVAAGGWKKPAEVVNNKRTSIPQASPSPLSHQKGVIYLNPQEIFRQNYGNGYENTLKRPSPYKKPSMPIPKKLTTSINKPAARPEPVTPIDIDDSDDSKDDLVFPENIIVPAPKVKSVADTFTTYWDMQSGDPILLNPSEDPSSQPVVVPTKLTSAMAATGTEATTAPVIEID